ncbi:unnamed protein product [Orchesella dallaii]|uniref:Uncharacterized protein n=1 Tax=Orchesella dallaii TaxID=48710 RepID=A0ABP1RV91_9HEXA
MEEWQVNCVSRNFDQLINTTICNESLLRKLVGMQMLTTEEVDNLTHPSQNRWTQARSLYNIMEARVNGFNALMNAFRATNQSGPLSILTTEADRWTFNELDDTIYVTYDTRNVIGTGSPGTIVCKGKFGAMDVAVKLTCHTVLHSSIKEAILNEVKILRECDGHLNIVRYFGSKIAADYIVIALELCDTTLSEWITNRSVELAPLEVLKQTTIGLEWLHSKNIIHRDLKPENILLKIARPKPLVKISDFGISKCVTVGRDYISTLGTGTLAWMAPEILNQTQNNGNNPIRFTFESDIFSLGCIYYYALTNGKHAFGNVLTSPGNILNGHMSIVPSDLVNAIPENLPFIEPMITTNPALRPSCSYLLSCTEFWANQIGDWSQRRSEVEPQKLICRLTEHDITMGYIKSDGRPNMIPNVDGEIHIETCLTITSNNEILIGKAAVTNNAESNGKLWQLYGILFKRGHYGCNISYNNEIFELTVKFFIGHFLKRLKEVAETTIGITFPIIILVVTVPMLLQHEADIQVGSIDIANFSKVQVVREVECLANAFQIETNGHLSNNEELLVISHSSHEKFSIFSLKLNIEIGLYKCGQNSSVTKIYEDHAVIRTRTNILLNFLTLQAHENVHQEPDTSILPRSLKSLLRSRRPKFAVVACEVTERRDFILRQLRKYNIDVRPLLNYKLAVTIGAELATANG